MRESGCRQVLIGLESPGADGLDGLEMRRNFKLRRLPSYEAAIDAIQRGNLTAAAKQLRAFIEEVEAMVRSGRMSAATEWTRKLQSKLISSPSSIHCPLNERHPVEPAKVVRPQYS